MRGDDVADDLAAALVGAAVDVDVLVSDCWLLEDFCIEWLCILDR